MQKRKTDYLRIVVKVTKKNRTRNVEIKGESGIKPTLNL